METHAASASRTLTLGICHPPAPGVHDSETLDFSSLPVSYYWQSHEDMPSSHSKSSFHPIASLRIALRSHRRLPGEGHTHKHELHPAPLPSECATPGWKRCGLHHGTFPKCTLEQDGGSAQLDLPCSNSFLPTWLPYVQDHLIARCMSKFSFLNVIFPRIYWHPTMLLLGCRSSFSAFWAQNRNHTQPWQ